MQLQENISLRHLNTFGIDASAAWYAEINDLADLHEIPAICKNHSQKLVLGGGSNILFTQNFPGLVIKNNLKGITEIKSDAEFTYIKAMAGEVWHYLVMYCVNHNLGGIENLSLIPGCVGAAPIQNIGAYGVELMDTFHSLEALEIETGKIISVDKQTCAFGYRNSIFKNAWKGKYIILSVTLRLYNTPQFNTSYGAIQQTLEKKGVTALSVKAISDAVIAIRQSKLPDPAIIGNAGSFFKNPEITKTQYEKVKQHFPDMPGYSTSAKTLKVPAGWMIEQCGWKGKRMGNTGAHKDQALVLVNYGNATGNEIFQLAMNIQKSVYDKFGITIEPEVNLV